MTEVPDTLNRFVRAQAGVYDRALAEIRAGDKRTHWMWFVFPQILGLGHSENARIYAIADCDEARRFLAHALLGPRLLECTQAMLGHAEEGNALTVLGVIDAMKFHSSMTLFDACCEGEDIFASALDAFYGGKRDQATLDRL